MSLIRMRPPAERSVFLTTGLSVRGSDLLLVEIELLRAAVRATMCRQPFRIDAWVVLPDHVHCVWTMPAGDDAAAGRWRAIKTHMSRALVRAGRLPEGCAARLAPGRRARGETGLWQRGVMQRWLGTQAERESAIRACWRDPVLHGLASRAEDWPWSSVHRDGAGAVPDSAGVCARGKGVPPIRQVAAPPVQRALPL